MPCPSGLHELSVCCDDPTDLLDLGCEHPLSLWEATPASHLRSVTKLQLTRADNLYVPMLAAMTALQSLHLETFAVPAAIGEAVPALAQLTRLDFWADVDEFEEAKASEYFALSRATRSAQLSRLLSMLSALPLLRHLQLGGTAFDEVQVLDGPAPLSALEVLDLPVDLQADDQLLTVLAHMDNPRYRGR